MKREFVLVLALCAFAAAMVPRQRRAVDTEAQDPTSPTTETPRICAPITPCGWETYHQYSRELDLVIVNTYCVCEKDLLCLIDDDIPLALTYVKRCKVPSAHSEALET